MIRKDRYLTPEEKEQLAQRQQRTADRVSGYEAYNAIKAAHPDDLVLYQVEDFFELYGEDAKAASTVLGLNLTTRAIPDVGRVELCGIPAYTLEQYVETLRGSYDVTISAVDTQSSERRIYSMRSIDHEAEQTIDSHEAEFGADGTRAFSGAVPAEATHVSDMSAQLERYLPVVRETVEQDTPYRNACGNSEKE